MRRRERAVCRPLCCVSLWGCAVWGVCPPPPRHPGSPPSLLPNVSPPQVSRPAPGWCVCQTAGGRAPGADVFLGPGLEVGCTHGSWSSSLPLAPSVQHTAGSPAGCSWLCCPVWTGDLWHIPRLRTAGVAAVGTESFFYLSCKLCVVSLYSLGLLPLRPWLHPLLLKE